jgi:ABC-type sugar transport system ATPase subunit
LRKEILRLQEELAITLIYVTHDREEAFSLATRIVVVADGRIQKIGTVSEITAYLSGSTENI